MAPADGMKITLVYAPAARELLERELELPPGSTLADSLQHSGWLLQHPELGSDGRVYNAAQWFDASGRRCLNYRKAYLFGELDRSQFAAEAQSAKATRRQESTCGASPARRVERRASQ